MRNFWALFSRNYLSVFGLIAISLVILISALAPILPLQDPVITDLPSKYLRPLSDNHLLGTDELGRDILSRLIWGTQTSLVIGFIAAVSAALVGSAIGLIAGYFGGRIDNIFMRFIDMLMAFPYILLALAIVAALGTGLINALIAVVIVNIPFFARNIRGVTLSYTHREFVEAARLMGKSNTKIIFTEILPNVMPVIVIAISTTIGWMILETAGLSFLGLGSQPPNSDLGSMLGQGRNALITDPHASIIPGLMIFVIVMSVNLIGDGIRDSLDPRLRSGVLSRPLARTKTELTEQEFKLKDSKKLLEVQKLSTEFRVNKRIYKAVNEISFDLSLGECIGIVGESGSGKSVTALSLMGLTPSPPGVITNGAVYFLGNNLLTANYELLRQMRGKRVSYIFQNPLETLHPLYTIKEQLLEAIHVHENNLTNDEALAKVIDLLKSVRIPNAKSRLDNYPHQLSGGMRQRVSIAMALANDPDIIIADEPTTALDVTVQAQILNLLSDLRKDRGLSIIFITHDFGVVAQLCDRIAVTYAGKFIEVGETKQILDQPAHPYTAGLIKCVPKLGAGRRKLSTIEGLPPAVDNLPNGCAFANRCSFAKSECRKSQIPLTKNYNRLLRCINPIKNQEVKK